MTERFTPGFIGISRGDQSINAVCLNPSGEPVFLQVTKDQARRIEEWASGDGLIQALLPDLTPDDRELLMTGIDGALWDAMFGEEEYDD